MGTARGDIEEASTKEALFVVLCNPETRLDLCSLFAKLRLANFPLLHSNKHCMRKPVCLTVEFDSIQNLGGMTGIVGGVGWYPDPC